MIQKIFFIFSKKYEKVWHTLLIGTIFLGAIGSTFLYFQYYKFRKISMELLDLKEDYRVYTNALKKILTDKAYEIEQSAQSDQKKKN